MHLPVHGWLGETLKKVKVESSGESPKVALWALFGFGRSATSVQHKLRCIRLVIIQPPKPLHDVGGLTQVLNAVDVSSWIFQYPSVVCCVAAV